MTAIERRSTHPIRFGVFTGVAQTTWPDLLEVWQRIDEMGFDTGWVPDHFYAGYGDPDGPCFEAGTVLAALAARTRRIGVGPLVLSNTFRHPAVLANMAASLDHVAEGRFTLGLGAGWLQSEHDGYALPFGTTRDRIERLDEALTVIRLLHTERRASFAGRFYRLDDALCEPKPYGGRRLPDPDRRGRGAPHAPGRREARGRVERRGGAERLCPEARRAPRALPRGRPQP